MALPLTIASGPMKSLVPLDAGLMGEFGPASLTRQALFGRWILLSEKNPWRMFRGQSMRAFVVLPLSLCLLLTACVPVPMKMRTRVTPVTGEELGGEPDTSVIQPGVTTQSEILHEFADFDTGWKGERLFLGRWLRSGFSANVNASNGRLWEGKNLVVEFDEKGAVIRYQVLSDQKFLNVENSGVLASEKDLPGFQQPASTQKCHEQNLPGNSQPTCGATVKIVNVMGKDLLEVSGACPGGFYAALLCPAAKYRIAAEQIEGLRAERWYNASHRVTDATKVYPPVANDFVLSIHLKERIRAEDTTERGKKDGGVKTLSLDTDMPTVLLLVRFLYITGTKQ